MCQKLIICIALIGFAAAQDVSRNEKGTGGNAQVADVSGSSSTQQISGMISGWDITKAGGCCKFYGKVINVPAGKTYSMFLIPSACSAAKSTDVKTLTPSHAGFIGSTPAATTDGQTYIIADNNKKGISAASIVGKSVVISDGTKIVGCGEFQKGEMVILIKPGVSEGTCP